jgi:acyl-CoA thioesterase II
VAQTTLAEILDLERIDDDIHRARTPPGTNRPDIFGGQVAGQALRAASLTVGEDHLPNSVHCYFLRRGRPDLPIDMHVERTRTGRTYSSRKVDARQEGRSILTMLASFHAEEPGRESEFPVPIGAMRPDEALSVDGTSLPGDDTSRWEVPFELQDVPVHGPGVRYWARVTTPFPADPFVHAAGLLYASDMRAGLAAMQLIGVDPFGTPGAPGEASPVTGNFGSLDHAMWFHRPARVDRWFFSDVRPLTVRDSRGLVFGTTHDAEGRHLATFTQEMFLKVTSP